MEEDIFYDGIMIGDNVPDCEFDVYLPEKKDFGKVNFSDLLDAGKWIILVFYPADFTFVCPTELADIAEKYQEFKECGAEVIAMSTDTHFVHYAWHKQEKLLQDVKFPMGADPAHDISALFGVYDENTGLALRGTFIIDPDGKLVSSEINYYNVGRSSDELMRKFKAFNHVRNNKSAVCPAKWEPGKKALIADDKDSIGNVSERLKTGA